MFERKYEIFINKKLFLRRMLIAQTKQVQDFCKKSKLKFNTEKEFFIANRQNAESKHKKNLLIKINQEKDYMKQKKTEIDEVFCKFAKEKEKNVFIDLNSFLENKNLVLSLQKLMQDMKLLKKYKLQYEFVYICKKIEEIISDKDIFALRKVLE